MNINVWPIAITSANFKALVDSMKDTLNIDAHRMLDNETLPTEDIARYVAVLASFKDGPVRSAMRTNIDILRHIFVTISTDAPLKIIQQLNDRGLNTLSFEADGDRYTTVSGTLADWKICIVNNTDMSVDSRTRFILNNVVLLMERTGLGIIFENQSKEKLQDGTFILKDK